MIIWEHFGLCLHLDYFKYLVALFFYVQQDYSELRNLEINKY